MTVQISLSAVKAKRDSQPPNSRLRAAFALYVRVLEVDAVARYLERHSDCPLLRLEQFVSWNCCPRHRELQKRSDALRAAGQAMLPAAPALGSVFSVLWWRRLGISHPVDNYEIVE